MIGLNEIAILAIVIAPFIYLITSNLEPKVKRLNRAERRKVNNKWK